MEYTKKIMHGLETIFILMFAAILLVGIAQKFHVPYPIALVLGGTAIGFIPELHPIYFDPNMLLLIVLPPILYYGAFGISFREFKQNWKQIFSLALGLVAVTTLVVGVIFKWMFPEFPWALAFAFGAIVSPPDAISATSILKRFAISSRLVTLLEGESLINDASALILYKIAVVALLSGTFSLLGGVLEFAQIVCGGILLGAILGILLQRFSRRYLEPVLGVVFSFTIPYITYIIATFIGVSGVLAVVVNGLIGARILFEHHSSLRRVLGYAVWDIFIILLNCFVFILIGLQLRSITNILTIQQIVIYTGYAALITLAMLIVRMLWVYTRTSFAYFKALRNPRASTICPEILREATVVGWSGMRGIVSLAAAIALPFTYPNGAPLEGRNETIFMTFVVILLTLLIPGFSLAALLRWLKIQPHSTHDDEENIRQELTKIAEKTLHELLTQQNISKNELDFLTAYFIAQSHIQQMAHAPENELQNMEVARLKVIQAQRKHLLEKWKQNEIDDKLLNHLENELDMLEVHIARATLN